MNDPTRRHHLVTLAGLSLLMTVIPACERQVEKPQPQQPALTWKALSQQDIAEKHQPQSDLATRAQQELSKQLIGELMAAMKDGGPPNAITVCSERASAIAGEVSQNLNVRIGRTSFKLRSPNNAPREWAQGAVDQRADSPVSYADAQGNFATLRPIRLAGLCLACHGAADQLAPGVTEALASRYPDDQATGFADGDLRGWFWIEVPPQN
jgi:mono/diheme cytochrome c family protein